MKAHQGHVGDGGICGHSAGPLFPWSVLGVGDTLVAFNGETGQRGITAHRYNFAIEGSFRRAHAKAEHDCRLLIGFSRLFKTVMTRPIRRAA